jgi:hypothetical protein
MRSINTRRESVEEEGHDHAIKEGVAVETAF